MNKGNNANERRNGTGEENMEWEDFYGPTINLLDGFLEYLDKSEQDICDDYVSVCYNSFPSKESIICEQEDDSATTNISSEFNSESDDEVDFESMNNYISLKRVDLKPATGGGREIRRVPTPPKPMAMNNINRRVELCPVSESSPLQDAAEVPSGSGLDSCSSSSPSTIALSLVSGPPSDLHQHNHPERPHSIISTSSSSTSSLPRSKPKYLSLDVNRGETMGVKATHKRSPSQSDPTLTMATSTTSRTPPHTAPTVRKEFDTNAYFVSKVILELLNTEKAYVKDLRDIAVGYKEYMASHEIFGFKERDFETIFINIADVYQFNKSFLVELEKCAGNVRLLAKCFVNEKDGFKVYEEYCTLFPKALKRLSIYMKWAHMADLFRDCQHKLKHSLPLGSYLLKPVQRILKYRLLLQNLLKYTERQSTVFDDVAMATECMSEIALRINEMKRRHERAVRAQEIQSLLSGWEGPDLSTVGHLVHEDQLRDGRSSRDVFLFEKVLILAKRKKEQFVYLNYKGAFWLSHMMLTENFVDNRRMFSVADFRDLRSRTTLEASSERQKEMWCIELKRLMAACSADSSDPDSSMSGSASDSEEIGLTRQSSVPSFFRQRFRRKSVTNIMQDLTSMAANISRSKSTTRKHSRKQSALNRSNPELSIHAIDKKLTPAQTAQMLKGSWYNKMERKLATDDDPSSLPSKLTRSHYVEKSPFSDVYVHNGRPRICDILSPESDTSSQISDSDSESVYDSLDEVSDPGKDSDDSSSCRSFNLMDDFQNVPFIDIDHDEHEISSEDYNKFVDRVSGAMAMHQRSLYEDNDTRHRGLALRHRLERKPDLNRTTGRGILPTRRCMSETSKKSRSLPGATAQAVVDDLTLKRAPRASHDEETQTILRQPLKKPPLKPKPKSISSRTLKVKTGATTSSRDTSQQNSYVKRIMTKFE